MTSNQFSNHIYWYMAAPGRSREHFCLFVWSVTACSYLNRQNSMPRPSNHVRTPPVHRSSLRRWSKTALRDICAQSHFSWAVAPSVTAPGYWPVTTRVDSRLVNETTTQWDRDWDQDQRLWDRDRDHVLWDRDQKLWDRDRDQSGKGSAINI